MTLASSCWPAWLCSTSLSANSRASEELKIALPAPANSTSTASRTLAEPACTSSREAGVSTGRSSGKKRANRSAHPHSGSVSVASRVVHIDHLHGKDLLNRYSGHTPGREKMSTKGTKNAAELGCREGFKNKWLKD